MSNVTAVPLQPVKRGYLVYLWLGIAAAVLVAAALAWQGTAAVVADRGTNEQFLAWNGRQPGVVTTASGLQYQVIHPGTGAYPSDSDVTLINYVGHLRDGHIFDQSRQPVAMPVSGVVPGFSEGLKRMQVGGSYRLWLKPQLAYGDQSPDPSLPAGSMLIFDVQLLGSMSATQYQQMMVMQQMQQGAGGAGVPSGSPVAPPGDAVPAGPPAGR